MQIELNNQREEYINARGRIVLNACPGSGKTTCLVYKLGILQKECLSKYGQYAGIACLSFTNKAKNEILVKYKTYHKEQLRYPHVVSTIDSFINHFLTLPFFNLINSDFKRPKIIDDEEVIDNSFKTRYKNNKGVWVDGIQYPLNTFKDKAGFAIYRSYRPSEIWIELDGTFSFNGKTPDEKNVAKDVFQNYCKEVFKLKLKKGLITGLDSAYLALSILEKYPRVGHWLATRFPYVLIDEAQDNSAVQDAIFDKLFDLGIKNVELIGDPYQSLYEWRDAKPLIFVEKFGNILWKGLFLTNNRRSNQRIIDCFSILRSADDERINSTGVLDMEIPITIYKYNDINPALIVKDFETKCNQKQFIKNQIVVRGNDLKDKMLGKAGSIEPWKGSIPLSILNIKYLFEMQNIKDAVNNLRAVVLRLLHPQMEYHDLKELEKKSKSDNIFNSVLYSLLFKIPSRGLPLEDWTNACMDLLKEFNADIIPYFEFKAKINGYKMAALKKDSVSKYFNKSATAETNIPISTIHQIKGATLDAILCFFNAKNHKENITLNDFKCPVGFPSEKQRLIYVACSRPSQFLALAFPNEVADLELKNKFGNGVEILFLQ